MTEPAGATPPAAARPTPATAPTPPPTPMTSAIPPTSSPAGSVPAPPPVPRPPVAPTTTPLPRLPRVGRSQDTGVVRRDSVRALAWWVNGTAKVTGEVDAGDVRVVGTLSVGGQVLADTFECRGTLEVEGGVNVVGRLSIDGTLRVAGSVHAAQGYFSGTTRIGRDVSVDRSLVVRGQFAAPSVRSEELHAEAAVEIPGAVEGVEVDLLLSGDSRLGTVRARSVRILRKPPNPFEKVLGRSPAPPVDRVEADHVELEGVDVAFVRSPEIILRRDAHVTEVEGTILRRHPTARVGPESRSPPPHGLSR
jgi:cytoskeletal protein CcmA (bactofilin family)